MNKSKFELLGRAGCLTGPAHYTQRTRGLVKWLSPRVSETGRGEAVRGDLGRTKSNRTATGHRPHRAAPARQNPNAAGGGCGRLTRAQARVDDGGERRSRRRRFSWYRQLLLGGSNRRLPSSPAAAGSGQIPAMCCSPCSGSEVGWF